MIDTWLKNDLQKIYEQHSIAVFIDESGDGEFLLKTLGAEYTIQQAHSELEELRIKYLFEKSQPCNERVLIYTRSKKDNLKFIREYCETCGTLEIRYLQNYIKDKVHQSLNLNINLPPEDLLAAAKMSIGKDQTYWMDIVHKGTTEIFDLKKELLPFVHDPKGYSQEKDDPQLFETFCVKVCELIGQDYITKPPLTLAGDVVKAMLDGLVHDNCEKSLESLYKRWIDSVASRDSFQRYIDSYTLASDLDIWKVSIDHPFRQIDERWLTEIGKSISDKAWITTTLSKLCQRNHSKQAQALGIVFWGDVITLLAFDPKTIACLSSFAECVDFYKNHFYKLDTAIRHLYAAFLNTKGLLEPFQELYKEYVSIFLDKWFHYFQGYQENQTGTLQRIIQDANGLKTAVIVGDGVAYEIAELVTTKVKGTAKLKKDAILADIPSETENNMSRIYLDNGVTEAVQGNREKYLVAQNPDLNIEFIRLDEVTEDARPEQVLICTYKDIDDMGEKLQQKALKYFPETIDFFAEKISLLLASGYSKVYLITDHGFVLTGLLSDSDKISVSLEGSVDKAERYLRTDIKQQNLAGLLEVERSYKEFNYLYFAKNINPFKTTGPYGFSHGGLSPQELITPYFCWERTGDLAPALSVSIENKEDLKDVTGDLFLIKMQADQSAGDLFSSSRKVYLAFFANKKQVSKSDVFSIKANEKIEKEYTFDGYAELDVHLLDATSKQQLDRTIVKQNNDRDLGGLFL